MSVSDKTEKFYDFLLEYYNYLIKKSLSFNGDSFNGDKGIILQSLTFDMIDMIKNTGKQYSPEQYVKRFEKLNKQAFENVYKNYKLYSPKNTINVVERYLNEELWLMYFKELVTTKKGDWINGRGHYKFS
jgi:hypothetical protein